MKRNVKIIILRHNNIPGPINLIPLLQIFSIFFILVIVFLLFINLHKLNKVQQLTNSLSEDIKSDVLYTELSDNFLIYHYSIIRLNRIELSKEIQQNTVFIDQLNDRPST